MPEKCQTMRWVISKGDSDWRFWLELPRTLENLFLCTELNHSIYHFKHYMVANPRGEDYEV